MHTLTMRSDVTVNVQPPIQFFLGSDTPDGFRYTTRLYETTDRVWLLKGGPGNGKSTLLKKLYHHLSDDTTEVYRCASDPDSWDAVRFRSRGICVMDATPPHAVEPIHIGAVEHIVCLSEYLDTGPLRQDASAIIALTDEVRVLHTQSQQYLRSAAALCADCRRLQQTVLDELKIKRLARRLAENEWRGERSGTPTLPEKRFLGALTPDGITVLHHTIQAMCPRIYTIVDDYGAAADLLLSELCRRAAADGIRHIVCPCVLFPDGGPEHLLLPDIGLCFTVSNHFHSADFPTFRRIHATRFYSLGTLHSHRARLSFLQHTTDEMLREATTSVAAAKAAHDRLEQYYVNAVNRERLQDLTARLLDQLRT